MGLKHNGEQKRRRAATQEEGRRNREEGKGAITEYNRKAKFGCYFDTNIRISLLFLWRLEGILWKIVRLRVKNLEGSQRMINFVLG